MDIDAQAAFRQLVLLEHPNGSGHTKYFNSWAGTDFNVRRSAGGKNVLEFAADMSRWKTDAGGKPVESDKGTVKVVVEHGPKLPPEWKDLTPPPPKPPAK